MLYFSYASNMSVRRLQSRIPEAKVVGTARLDGYALCFHKVSLKDGSGKGDAFFTGNPADSVFGVLYELSDSDQEELDIIEGVGVGYEGKMVTVFTKNQDIEAYTYIALLIDKSLHPLHWYKWHVLIGAIENKLPAKYIQMIDSFHSISDPHPQRSIKELNIYSC